jgi:hypothetical protein
MGHGASHNKVVRPRGAPGPEGEKQRPQGISHDIRDVVRRVRGLMGGESTAGFACCQDDAEVLRAV